MKLPIPQDWDGESWICVRVQWPDSVQYVGLLFGFLTYLTRGRIYDEKTGSIVSAQNIGWAIHDKNFPLQYCGETGETPITNGQSGVSGARAFVGDFFSGEGNDMPGSIMDIRCQNGELQVQYFPCCEWVTICKITDFVPEWPDDGSPYPDEPPSGAGNACRKAYGAGVAAFAAADAMWQAYDDNQTLTYVYQTYSYYWGDYPWLNRAWVDCKTGDIADWNANKATYQMALICLWQNAFNDLTDPLTETDFANMKTAIASSGMPYQTQIIFRTVLEAMTIGKLSNYAIAGLDNPSADCTCPADLDPLEEPTASGWYAVSYISDCEVSHASSASNWTGGGFVHDNVAHDVFGLIMDIEVVTTTGITPMNDSHATSAEDEVSTCGTFSDLDETMSGDSSGQMANTVRYCHGHSDALDEIFGSGTYNLIANGHTWSNNPASPDFNAGDTINAYYRANPWKTAFTIRFKNVYLIHNTNSPSHA